MGWVGETTGLNLHQSCHSFHSLSSSLVILTWPFYHLFSVWKYQLSYVLITVIFIMYIIYTLWRHILVLYLLCSLTLAGVMQINYCYRTYTTDFRFLKYWYCTNMIYVHFYGSYLCVLSHYFHTVFKWIRFIQPHFIFKLMRGWRI